VARLLEVVAAPETLVTLLQAWHLEVCLLEAVPSFEDLLRVLETLVTSLQAWHVLQAQQRPAAHLREERGAPHHDPCRLPDATGP